MSDWTVHLVFEEGNSSKFWRAKVEGKTLHVNYGKIGSPGQRTVKDFADAAAASGEYEKLVKEKRKKGYADAEGGEEAAEEDKDEEEEDEDGEEEDEEEDEAPKKKGKAAPAAAAPAAAPAAAAAKPSTPGHRFVLDAGNRKVEATLYLDGKTVRMDSVESYASPDAASKAFERLKKMLAGEGYKAS